MDTEAAVNKIATLLRAAEHQDYIGEDVSQLTHALQAAQLAREDGHGDDVVLAALLHDIGHLCAQPGAEMMANVGVKGHENIGAAYLRKLGFSGLVAELVEAHVTAKRYLTATDPAYYAKLSDASKTTLRYQVGQSGQSVSQSLTRGLQGGPMSQEEVAAFLQDPLFALKVKVSLVFFFFYHFIAPPPLTTDEALGRGCQAHRLGRAQSRLVPSPDCAAFAAAAGCLGVAGCIHLWSPSLSISYSIPISSPSIAVMYSPV